MEYSYSTYRGREDGVAAVVSRLLLIVISVLSTTTNQTLSQIIVTQRAFVDSVSIRR